MGTDIHFTVENKTADAPTWIGVYSTSVTPNFPLADIDGNNAKFDHRAHNGYEQYEVQM